MAGQRTRTSRERGRAKCRSIFSRNNRTGISRPMQLGCKTRPMQDIGQPVLWLHAGNLRLDVRCWLHTYFNVMKEGGRTGSGERRAGEGRGEGSRTRGESCSRGGGEDGSLEGGGGSPGKGCSRDGENRTRKRGRKRNCQVNKNKPAERPAGVMSLLLDVLHRRIDAHDNIRNERLSRVFIMLRQPLGQP